MIKQITISYKIGDKVYLKVVPDKVYIITGMIVRQRSVSYAISDGEVESWHFGCELEPAVKPVKVSGFKKN